MEKKNVFLVPIWYKKEAGVPAVGAGVYPEQAINYRADSLGSLVTLVDPTDTVQLDFILNSTASVEADAVFIRNIAPDLTLQASWGLSNGAAIAADATYTKVLGDQTQWLYMEFPLMLGTDWSVVQYNDLAADSYFYIYTDIVVAKRIECEMFNEGYSIVYEYKSVQKDYTFTRAGLGYTKTWSFSWSEISEDVAKNLVETLNTIRQPIFLLTVNQLTGLVERCIKLIINNDTISSTKDAWGTYNLELTGIEVQP